jgi:Sulfotransferase family
MTEGFRLLMLGAMYENGGNTTHRFLDGHPELFVYPFESQLGTRLVADHLTSLFPAKYRWPVFALDGTAEQDYRAIIDEEGKVRARTPFVSKFRDYPFDLNDDERMRLFVERVVERQRSTAGNVAAFFEATFDAWHDYNRSGQESVYVGYSPVLVVDAERILETMPDAHFLHIVRNPWSAYADTKKRPVPLPLATYVLGWTLNQQYALRLREQFRGRFHLVRAEDVMADSVEALRPVCEALGIDPESESLQQVSWNGQTLEQVYPWGTIRTPTPTANRETAAELSHDEQSEIRSRTQPFLAPLGYETFPD